MYAAAAAKVSFSSRLWRVTALLLAAALAVQDGDAEIKQWIEDLGSDSVEVREAATKKLIEKEEGAAAQVRAALATDDPEKKARLRLILAEIDPECARILVDAMKLKDVKNDDERVKAQRVVWGHLEKLVELCDAESRLALGGQALKAAEGNAPGELRIGHEDAPAWVIGGAHEARREVNRVIVAAGDVDLQVAESCVILASGRVRIQSARACVVIARGDAEIARVLGGVALAGGRLKGSLAWQAEVGALGGADGVKLSGGAALWGDGFEEPIESKGAEVRSKKMKRVLRTLSATP